MVGNHAQSQGVAPSAVARVMVEGSCVSCAFDPSLELGQVQEDATVRCLAPDATLHPNPTFDLVAHRVFAVAGDFGKPIDEYPSAWVAHGVLLVVATA